MTVSEFSGPNLTEAQWQQIKGLATSLDPKQLLWVSGFFAGLDYGRHADPVGSEGATALLPEAGRQPATRTLTVLYGSETGHSTAIAKALADRAKAQGLSVQTFDMAAFKPRQLKELQDVLIVVSTYGEGDPPQPAVGFFEFVEGRKAAKLPDVRFAVLALGDSTYERYCEAGKRLDRRFEELGATRLKPRVDCDVDYDEPAEAWVADVLSSLEAERSRTAEPAVACQPAAPSLTGSAAFDKRNPLAARIIDNIVLTGRGSSKETRHVELSLEGSGLSFTPGDSLAIMPRNDPLVVETILQELALGASAPLTIKDKVTPIGEALSTEFEIAALTPRFLEHWAGITDAEELKHLLQPDRSEDRIAFMRGHHVVDVLRRFPARDIDPETFVAGLRRLQPRLYSIASSQAAAPDEAHLTVSVVRYDLFGEPRAGVASGQLATRGEPDSVLPVYVQPNPHFRLPADDVAIIMIGAGTGVAPYRAFMQEREARGAAGKSWLVFGERNFRTDFLYQTEWQTLLKDGVLSRMDVAFSRDRRTDGRAKMYVQDRLKEAQRDVFAWLEEGAHLYLCGDATHLAPDVHRTLASIVASEGGLSPEAAEDYLRRLQDEHRYQRDVY
jgi:sulfite reductase (NADPH) flavoprotein alpha-component